MRGRINAHSLPGPVVLYAVAPSDQPSPDLSHAVTRGPRRPPIAGTFHDPSAAIAPEERPGWQRVRAAIAAGYATGVVAFDRMAISPDDDLYLEELEWLGARYAFLHLLRDETEAR
ncbi:hypothetical protein GCM10027160_37580 [Streptomyces calidiresistens]